MAEVLVIDDCVHEESDDAQDPEGDQLVAEQVGKVQAELKAVIVVADLHDEAAHHHHEDEQHLDEHERKQLAAEQYPAADGSASMI